MSTETQPLPETGTIVPLPPELLSPSEQEELQALEVRIEKGLETFMDVGLALATIRDKQLYRAKFRTFEAYCQEQWGMSGRRARQIRDGAAVFQVLKGNNCSVLPATESQVRPLVGLSPDQQTVAWSAAVAAAPNGKPTARHVENAVRALKGRDPLPVPAKSGTIVPLQPGPVIDAGPKEEQLEAEVKKAIAQVRKLMDEAGTVDSVAGAELTGALYRLEKFQEHLKRTQERFERL